MSENPNQDTDSVPNPDQPHSLTPNKKVTLIGETDSQGNLFITGYKNQDQTTLTEPKIPYGTAINELKGKNEYPQYSNPFSEVGGRKSRRYKKTGKKQKGRKSRKQRK